MTDRTGKPRSMSGAEALWPGHVARLHDEPTDENLQSLCTLLDVIDAEIGKRWGTAGQTERLALLRSFRGVARRCNGLVADANRLARAEAGRRNAAKRKAAA